MDHDRRMLLAAIIQRQLPDIQQAVVASWTDLLPAAQHWEGPSRIRAEKAVQAALGAAVTVIAQGDLDEASFADTRAVVGAHGLADADEIGELLRTVRIVGLESLLGRLTSDADLRSDERRTIQGEVHSFLESLDRPHVPINAATVDALLAEMAASEPDLG